MRKFILVPLLIFLCVGFFHRELLKACASITYTSVGLEKGALVLSDVSIFREEYSVRSDKVFVSPFRLKVERPHVILTAAALQSKSHSRWAVEIEDGILDWKGGELPPARFSLRHNQETTEMHVNWEQGSLSYVDEVVECKDIPFHFLEGAAALQGWAFPVENGEGTWSGRFERNFFQAEGSSLGFNWGEIRCSGSFSLDCHQSEGLYLPERIRLTVSDGKLTTGSAEIGHLEILGTLQSDVGAKLECRGDGLSLVAKGFFSSEGPVWVKGEGNFGAAPFEVSWEKGAPGAFHFDRFGADEANLAFRFLSFIDSRLCNLEMVSGLIEGRGGFDQHVYLESLQGNDLFIKTSVANAGCKKLLLHEGKWDAKGGWIGQLFQGSGRWDGSQLEVEGEMSGANAHFLWNREGPLRGAVGDLHLIGDLSFLGRDPKLTISELSGPIPFFPGIVNSGLFRMDSLDDWSFRCKIAEAKISYVSDLQFDLVADASQIEVLSAEGFLDFYSLKVPIKAPHLRIAGESASFDVRVEQNQWDILRLAGTKVGPAIEIDRERSSLFGSELHFSDLIWENGTVVSGALKTSLDSALFSKVFEGIESVGRLQLSGNLDKKIIGFDVLGDPFALSCDLGIEDLEVRNGKASWKKSLLFDFEGKLHSDLRAFFQLTNLKGDLGELGVSGTILGAGCVTMDRSGVESDLDLTATPLVLNGYQFENRGSLHLSLSSAGRALLTGVEGTLSKDKLEASAKAEWIGWNEGVFEARGAHLYGPSELALFNIADPGTHFELEGDASYSENKFECTIPEAVFPIAGRLRQLKDLTVSCKAGAWDGSAFLEEDLVTLAMDSQGGRFRIGELFVDWSSDGVQSVEGSFGGIAASFHLDQKKLVGSAELDFHALSSWIPPSVAQAFIDLEMGKGYRFKGSIDPMSLSCVGKIFGKDAEFFGLQFQTMIADIEINPDLIRISDVKMSDPGAFIVIDELVMKDESPWTIQMPHLTITDLRPSLLRIPGVPLGPLTPLLVRSFSMRDFHGLLDDGLTYKAKGDISFINTFKRKETLFHIPSNILGRIIGLDFDLLTPVIGEIAFDLHDGFFHLTELKNAFSEGGRSEFFLVNDSAPRVDLRGNLQILVQTKQYVLFALTEGFLISIEGKLNDPRFGLKKKSRFL